MVDVMNSGRNQSVDPRVESPIEALAWLTADIRLSEFGRFGESESWSKHVPLRNLGEKNNGWSIYTYIGLYRVYYS